MDTLSQQHIVDSLPKPVHQVMQLNMEGQDEPVGHFSKPSPQDWPRGAEGQLLQIDAHVR